MKENSPPETPILTLVATDPDPAPYGSLTVPKPTGFLEGAGPSSGRKNSSGGLAYAVVGDKLAQLFGVDQNGM